MKDKWGNEVSTKEFFVRWKQGIENVTPLQQTKISLFGIFLIVVGIIIGIITTVFTKTWWLTIILTGSLFLTSMNLIGQLQKLFSLNKLYKFEGEENEQQGSI